MANSTTKTYTNQKPLVLPDDATAEWTAIDIEFASAAYSVNDLILAAKLPTSYKVVDWMFQPANVGTTLTLSLGVANAALTDLSTEVWGTGIPANGTALTRNASNASAQGDLNGPPDRVVGTFADRVVAFKVSAIAGYAGTGKVGQLLLLIQG